MHLEIKNVPENATVSLFVLMPEHVTEAYVSWLNTPDINQYLESRFVTHTVESTRAFVATTLASPNNVFFGIKCRLLDRHVGNIKLGPINQHHGTGDIGILIGDKAAWGKGVATSAISVISEIARNQLGLRKLTASCYASNGGSRRAFEKTGFVVEGIRPAQVLLNGIPDDVVVMGCILE
jgi:RimJ/RimL family protein N-acetyltransferase